MISLFVNEFPLPNGHYNIFQNNLHEVFQGYGFIQRIVIFNKHGQLQAMVEYPFLMIFPGLLC